MGISKSSRSTEVFHIHNIKMFCRQCPNCLSSREPGIVVEGDTSVLEYKLVCLDCNWTPNRFAHNERDALKVWNDVRYRKDD